MGKLRSTLLGLAVTTAAANFALASDDTAAAEAPDPELVAAGEKAFKKCKACHQIGEGAENKTGPHLNGVLGRTAAGLEDFKKYSKGMKKAGEEGLVWNAETMAEYLEKPRSMIKGTRMSFAGFKKEEEIEAVIAYISVSGGLAAE